MSNPTLVYITSLLAEKVQEFINYLLENLDFLADEKNEVYIMRKLLLVFLLSAIFVSSVQPKVQLQTTGIERLKAAIGSFANKAARELEITSIGIGDLILNTFSKGLGIAIGGMTGLCAAQFQKSWIEDMNTQKTINKSPCGKFALEEGKIPSPIIILLIWTGEYAVRKSFLWLGKKIVDDDEDKKEKMKEAAQIASWATYLFAHIPHQ